MDIERKYIVDERNRKIAVQLDIKTFARIEQILENYALVQLMQEADDEDEPLALEQARSFYESLEKANRKDIYKFWP
jgi:hypothetical protein